MTLDSVLAAVKALPPDWGISGSLHPTVLDRFAFHAAYRPIARSAETGTGRSTLLLSHASAHHTVFTLESQSEYDTLPSVRSSPLLRRETVEFILGPSQRTVPAHAFAGPLQFVLLDGPHGFPFPHLEYYHLHPHLEPGGILVIDDVHLRTVHSLFEFLRDDAMWELLEVVRTTAFFRRTDAPTLDPLGDGWWLQGRNRRAWPPLAGLPWREQLKSLVPMPLRERLRRLGGPRTRNPAHGG